MVRGVHHHSRRNVARSHSVAETLAVSIPWFVRVVRTESCVVVAMVGSGGGRLIRIVRIGMRNTVSLVGLFRVEFTKVVRWNRIAAFTVTMLTLGSAKK